MTNMNKSNRLGANKIYEHLKPIVENGLKSVLLFGAVDNKHKDETGTVAASPLNPVFSAIKVIKDKFPKLLIVCDVCLCDYTKSGACCIYTKDGRINNMATIERLSEISLKYVIAGCHVIAPSDMMDFRVKAIRDKLDSAGYEGNAAIMSYAAKFASCMYQPFRSAINLPIATIDRSLHQLPIKAQHLAKRAVVCI